MVSFICGFLFTDLLLQASRPVVVLIDKLSQSNSINLLCGAQQRVTQFDLSFFIVVESARYFGFDRILTGSNCLNFRPGNS